MTMSQDMMEEPMEVQDFIYQSFSYPQHLPVHKGTHLGYVMMTK